MQNVISLQGQIDRLEQEKWDLILAGAEVKPELQKKFEIADKKLEKLYAWFAKAYSNGVIHGTKSQLRPGILVTGKVEAGKRPA